MLAKTNHDSLEKLCPTSTINRHNNFINVKYTYQFEFVNIPVEAVVVFYEFKRGSHCFGNFFIKVIDVM